MTKSKNLKTVVIEENIFYENDMKNANVLNPEDTEMNRENPDTLRADADTDYFTSVEAEQDQNPSSLILPPNSSSWYNLTPQYI